MKLLVYGDYGKFYDTLYLCEYHADKHGNVGDAGRDYEVVERDLYAE